MPEILNGRYKKGQKLGEGAFAKVYLALDTKTGREHAIKRIDKERLKEENMDDQMKREIAVQRMLEHENCVRLYEVFETPKHIFLVLELVRGGELFDRLVAAQRFDEPTARRYFQQLVTGLYYCHLQGVAHRDLKPENLLLDEKDNLKITDFGLSNFQKMATGGSREKELLQTVCGTPNYIAPEVLKEQGYDGCKADIWTSGVILFVMCAGYLPFDDESDNLNALFRLIERGDYQMERSFSKGLKDIINRILQVEPTTRLTLDQIIRHPWFVPGFDNSQILAFQGATRLKPTEAQVKASVTGGEVAGGKDTSKPPEPMANAFQIISGLTGSQLVNLIHGGTHGSRPPMTRVFLKGSKADSMGELVKALDSLKVTRDAKSDDTELRCLGKLKGPIQFMIRVERTVSPRITMVTFRKTRGDTLAFQELYRKIVVALGAVVANRIQPAT
eukprot:TRINITY_DN2993_c6_g1_i1.p1 TRINITY_DN2993_c6_g1~~TRINITY_DN2993_c6_g1_i1.p1  ORF type:complete len:446 (+),score=147.69 TRINITY_DN2993_c6_g1_i1:99-1436(+)